MFVLLPFATEKKRETKTTSKQRGRTEEKQDVNRWLCNRQFRTLMLFWLTLPIACVQHKYARTSCVCNTLMLFCSAYHRRLISRRFSIRVFFFFFIGMRLLFLFSLFGKFVNCSMVCMNRLTRYSETVIANFKSSRSVVFVLFRMSNWIFSHQITLGSLTFSSSSKTDKTERERENVEIMSFCFTIRTKYNCILVALTVGKW